MRIWSFEALATRLLALFPAFHGEDTSSLAIGRHTIGSMVEPIGVDAIQALIQRRLPSSYHDQFALSLSDSVASSTSYDAFTIHHDPSAHGKSSKIHIKSSSVSGLSRGVLSFVREHGVDIGWSGDSFDHLPDMSEEGLDLKGESWARWRYFLNVVSLSYTTVWYDFEKWEYLLDWASLHGFNMLLALGGQEYVWAEVYKDFGMTEDQALGYFSGPAFQAWQRMGNIHGSWGMNTTREWVDKQWDLQKKLVSRMLALGMTPILPAFSGFVPEELNQYIGGPEFIRASNWNGFSLENTNNTAIDPTWETWDVVQSAFLKKQQELYGGWTSHYYAVDLYNELDPPSFDLDYLIKNTRSVVQSLKNVDPDAVWVMQGWLFTQDKRWNKETIRALMDGAKKDEMLVLDLAAEARPIWNGTDSYFDHEWLWCHLMNYGQEQGFYGDLTHYVNEIIRALKDSDTNIGMGLTMEGMNQNELVYELVSDTAWSRKVIDPVKWLHTFTRNRYALHSIDDKSTRHKIQKAWRMIAETAYENQNPDLKAVDKSPLEMVPGPSITQSELQTYNKSAIVEALDLLVQAADRSPDLLERGGFKYDLVDVARQVFMNAGDTMYKQMIVAWKNSEYDQNKINHLGQSIVNLLRDVDVILGTDEHFSLADWIKDARSWSDDPETQDFLEYQCRNQISVWGTENILPWPLNRYASKSWHGVVGSLYATNWEAFYPLREPPVRYSTELYGVDQSGPQEYNHAAWLSELRSIESEWNLLIENGEDTNPVNRSAMEVIKEYSEKWAAWL